MNEKITEFENEVLASLNKTRNDFNESLWDDDSFILSAIKYLNKNKPYHNEEEDDEYYDEEDEYYDEDSFSLYDLADILSPSKWLNKEIVFDILKGNLNSFFLSKVPEELWNDWHFVSYLIQDNNGNIIPLYYASDSVLSNKTVIDIALDNIQYRDDDICVGMGDYVSNFFIIFEIMKLIGEPLWFEEDFIENTLIPWLEEYEHYFDLNNLNGYETFINSIPKFVLENKDRIKPIITFIVENNFESLEQLKNIVTKEIWDDKEFILSLIDIDQDAINYASDTLKNDSEFISLIK